MGHGFSDVAVLIPCYNEEATIGQVIESFQSSLPGAVIYVYDNCSTDDTVKIAKQSGAVIRHCSIQGKGAVVQQMFRDVEEGRILMVDGDGTYPSEYARVLLTRLKGHDMVIGDRLSYNYYEDNHRFGHGLGNWLVRLLVNLVFGGHVTDVMTGYRVFTKEFVKSIELTTTGFEVETEMTVWALIHKRRIASVPILYMDRPQGSKSKLHTVRDGFKVLCFIYKKAVSYLFFKLPKFARRGMVLILGLLLAIVSLLCARLIVGG